MNRMPVAERREQLIAAARAVASREGIDGTTVRAVAAEAGVSLGVVHYCFEDKDELLRAVARVHERSPEATLLLVGPTSPGFDLDRRLQRLGFAGESLVRVDWVDESRLWALMAACEHSGIKPSQFARLCVVARLTAEGWLPPPTINHPNYQRPDNGAKVSL